MENESLFKPNPKLKLMDQVREVLRYYHYAYRTEQTYCKWIMGFIRFFEGKKRSEDPRSGAIRRHHVLPSGLQKAIKRAVHKARIHKKAGCQTLRHYADSRIMPTKHIKSGALFTPLQFESA